MIVGDPDTIINRALLVVGGRSVSNNIGQTSDGRTIEAKVGQGADGKELRLIIGSESCAVSFTKGRELRRSLLEPECKLRQFIESGGKQGAIPEQALA